MNYKLITIIILCIVFVYRLVLLYLKIQSTKNKIPDNVADLYDKETYAKYCAYSRESNRLGVISACINFIVELLLFCLNVFAAFAGLFPDSVFMQLFAVMLLYCLTDIVTLPLEYYDTMKIEGKYGFNKTTASTFFADKIKSFIISLVIFTVIAWILSLLHDALGNYMALAFAGFLAIFFLLIAFLFPVFTRIFNKFTPLEEGELRTKLTALLSKHGFKVREIEIMDGSKRTTKANAYFTGLGKMKTIVLYDTLVNNYTPDEICAVFSHELGHGIHHDTAKTQILSFIQVSILAALAGLTVSMPEIFNAFGFTGINYGFAVLFILNVEYSLIHPLYEIFTNAISRHNEYKADENAAEEGYGEQLIASLKKLTKESFGDIAPSPALIILKYDHPSLSQRIAAMETKLGKKIS